MWDITLKYKTINTYSLLITLPLNLNWSREMNSHHILEPSSRNPQLDGILELK